MSLGLDRIHQGDCVTLLRKVAAESVDLVFADPPFNIGYDYDVYDDRREADEYLNWSREWIEGVRRVLKPDGTFWLAIGDDFAAELKVLCTRDLGFHCRSWVVWYYTFGVHCKYKFTRSHTHLFHFVKDRKNFTFNSLDVRVPSARELVYGDKRADKNGRVPDDTWMMPPIEARDEGIPARRERRDVDRASVDRNRSNGAKNSGSKGRKAPSSRMPDYQITRSADKSVPDMGLVSPIPPDVPTVDGFILRPQDIPDRFAPENDTWFFSRVAGTFNERRGWHGCQMPEQLLGRVIRACSNEGDLVLDPFGGSGTTLAVAKKLGRRFLGFELSAEYARNIEARLAAIRSGDPLTGPENAATSAPTTKNGRHLKSVKPGRPRKPRIGVA